MYENFTRAIDAPNPRVQKLLFIMRLTIVLLIASMMQVSAASFAQRITLKQKNVSLEKVFRAIQSQTGYDFLYDRRILSEKNAVDINVSNKSIEEVLNLCFSGQQLDYTIKDKTVVVKEKKKTEADKTPTGIDRLVSVLPVTNARIRLTITGKVTDTTGIPIPGASVIATTKIKTATQTDQNGKFVIDVEVGTILKISYIGYKEQTVTVTEDTKVLNIRLSEANMLSDEVVITALGQKQNREAVVGSVTTVKPGELKIPSSNLTNALAGQASGIIAYQGNGQPGQDNSTFFIRGVTTFGYKVDPLILIDNIELTTNDLARLQVDDIASFSILKDASATALYGARGANGVILVSTKQGKVGKPQVSFRLENSISESVQTLKLSDPITYMNLYNEATLSRDPLLPVPFSQDKIINTQNTIDGGPGNNPYVYPAVDWLKLLIKKRTTTQRANMSVSGGTPFARYYVGGSYNLDHGNLREDPANNNDNNVKFQNYQLRSNVNLDLTKSTELILRFSGTFSEYGGPLTTDNSFSSDVYKIATHTSPVLFPAYFPADEANRSTQHILFGAPAEKGVAYNNPYALLMRGHKNSSESRMLAQVELNQKLDFLTDGLAFHGIFSTNRFSYFDSNLAYKPFYYNIGSYDKRTNVYSLTWLNQEKDEAIEYLEYFKGTPTISNQLYMQGNLDYNKMFGNHNVTGTMIFTRQQTVYSNADKLIDALPHRNLGLAGRAGYNYKGKYFVEFNFGYNGSERFSANHRYGFFPTIGAGWLLSQEKFFEPLLDVFDRVKLRGSYGLVGNDAISDRRFFYVSNVNLNGGGGASFGTNGGYIRNGVTIQNYADPNVTWETSKQANLALEFSMFKKLNVTAEIYNYNRYNILQKRSYIPSTNGLETDIFANLGKANSRGVDLTVEYKHVVNNSLSITGRGNLTLATDKYTFYEEPDYKEPWRHFVGQPIRAGYGLIAERLFVDDAEAQSSPRQIFSTTGKAPKGGDIKYRDLNGDGKIDNLDQTFMGYPQVPELVYGYGVSTMYKNFDLSLFFQGQARVSFFIDPNKVSPFVQSQEAYVYGNTQLLKQFAENHWSESNQDQYALYPRLGVDRTDIENNLQASSWWLRSGSFLRLKSAEFGYTLPTKMSKNIGIKNCRIYLSGLNLITWSSFKLWDPELLGNGFNYPIQKVFNLGINVTL